MSSYGYRVFFAICKVPSVLLEADTKSVQIFLQEGLGSDLIMPFSRGKFVATQMILKPVPLKTAVDQSTTTVHKKRCKSRAWASKLFFPGGGTRGFFQSFSRGGKKWRNLLFTTRNKKNNFFLLKFSKSRWGLGPEDFEIFKIQVLGRGGLVLPVPAHDLEDDDFEILQCVTIIAKRCLSHVTDKNPHK